VAQARCHGRRSVGLTPWLGGACLGLAGLLLLTAFATAPGQALALLLACALLLALGREVAVPAALLAGGAAGLVAAQLILVDAGLVLLLVPRIAGPQPPAVVATSARRRNGARRPGSPAALFRRALVPFAFLGPLVATLMGEAAGLPSRRLLVAVCAASATAVLGWTFLYATALRLLGKPALVGALAVAVPLALLGAAVALVGSRRAARAALRA
jgi:hypothetical protein